MSTIADKLRYADRVYYLIEIDFKGQKKRISTHDVIVPYSAGTDLSFKGIIVNDISVGNKFDFRAFKYNQQSITVRINNKDRWQDLESVMEPDGSKATVWIWCNGLDWADIETEGKVYSAIFRKNEHNKKEYSFTLNDLFYEKLGYIEAPLIYADGGYTGGDATDQAKRYPIFFGTTSGRSLPLPNIVSLDQYAAFWGTSYTTDAAFVAGTDTVESAVGVVGSGQMDYVTHVDAKGNLLQVMDFTNVTVGEGPVYISMRGYVDGSGFYTGTAGTIISNPAAIPHYAIDVFTDVDNADIDHNSFYHVQSFFSDAVDSSAILSRVNTHDYATRILSPFQAAILQKKGKVAAMAINYDTKAIKDYINTDTDTTGNIKISRTPISIIANRFELKYNYKWSNGTYNATASRDKDSSSDCEKSVDFYGETATKTINYADTTQALTAKIILDRSVKYYAYRHHLLQITVPMWKGFDLYEGDVVGVTCPEGPSTDGGGWVDEAFALMEKQYNNQNITLTLWKIEP